MMKAFLHHPLASPDLIHQIDSALFEHARLDNGLYILATVLLQHYRFNTLKMQDMGQQQSGRTRADDADLCAKCLQGVCLHFNVVQPVAICDKQSSCQAAGATARARMATMLA